VRVELQGGGKVESRDTAGAGAKGPVLSLEAIDENLRILRNMLDDMTRLRRTMEGYYTGGNCDPAYTCVRALKAHKRTHPDYQAYQARETGDNSAHVKNLWRETDRCIRTKLTPKQREALILCRLREVTQEQVAEIMGISQPMVHKHVEAAIKKIRKELAPVAGNRL